MQCLMGIVVLERLSQEISLSRASGRFVPGRCSLLGKVLGIREGWSCREFEAPLTRVSSELQLAEETSGSPGSRSGLLALSLKELLRAKLIECGWKDQLKAHCKDVIKEKGLEHVTVDDLVAEITPKGRALVPDSVKKELLQRIRTFLAQHASL
ncbi:Transcription and mRNA export factor ENY2 [Crotalus adamanteus]|uniref:Transcription and mRNA export factor ENY2 n=3 Tax=Sauria TaxID=32561 RepID=A0AAW1BLP0_CROAD